MPLWAWCTLGYHSTIRLGHITFTLLNYNCFRLVPLQLWCLSLFIAKWIWILFNIRESWSESLQSFQWSCRLAHAARSDDTSHCGCSWGVLVGSQSQWLRCQRRILKPLKFSYLFVGRNSRFLYQRISIWKPWKLSARLSLGKLLFASIWYGRQSFRLI